MDAATIRRERRLPASTQVGLALLLLLAAGASWAVTGDRMSGMDAGPGGDLGTLDWFIVGWGAMMAAMMLPSLVPAALTFTRIRRGRSREGTSSLGTTGIFVAGYLAPWVLVGVLAYAIIQGVRSLAPAFLSWDEAGPYLAGGVIIGAALYELTPAKRACLRHCRGPELLARDWRPGRIGAARTGSVHGGFCVGCCWALMAALFALGVMSIGWMIFIAALIALEKLLPADPQPSIAVAALLAVLGVAVAFTASDVPGLTIPGSPAAERAMQAMGMDRGDGAMDMNRAMMRCARPTRACLAEPTRRPTPTRRKRDDGARGGDAGGMESRTRGAARGREGADPAER
jgi:predicted metal-binding membrane protein